MTPQPSGSDHPGDPDSPTNDCSAWGSADFHTRTAASPSPADDGKVIGPYRLLELLGSGGMGEVWLAEQNHPVRRRVALKLIKAGMDTREVVTRFESERQALALMDHPAIARIFDAGATPEGRPYFVMEYVAGVPITQFCDKHRLTTRQRMELFIRVCEGVQHAHQKAIIHRDLKPSNILVCEVDGKPMPRIIDFGVAKATSQRLTANAMYTRVGAILGTLGYISPEQADSAGEDIDTRSDVYSLGVVLYELLVGALPFNFQKVPFDEILRRLRTDDAPPPSTKVRTLAGASLVAAQNRGADPPTLTRQLRGDADAIAVKAVEKDRNRRYATPSELAADIARYLRNEPVLARPASGIYRARKYVRRHRVAVAVAAALILLLAAFAVIQTVELRRITRERALAEQRASDLLDLANRTLFDVHDAIQNLPGAVVARRTIVRTTLDYLQRLARERGQDERSQRVLSDAYLKIAMIQGNPFGPSLDDFAGARQSMQKAEALLAPLYRANSGDPELMQRWLRLEIALASLDGAANRRAQATRTLVALLPVARRLAPLRPADYEASAQEAEVEYHLADIVHYDDPRAALEHANRHLALRRDLLARFPREPDVKMQLGVALGMTAATHVTHGDLEQAADLYRQSIEIREQLLAADPNNVAVKRGLLVAYGNYCVVLGVPWLANLDRPAEARQACTRAVALARAMANADAQDVTARADLAATLVRLGSIDPSAGGVAESLANLREAVAILDPIAKSNRQGWHIASDLTIAREYAGHRLEALGRPAEAEEQYKQSLAFAESLVNAGNLSMRAQLLADEEALALLYANSGQRAAAYDFARRAMAVSQAPEALSQDVRNGRQARALFVLASVQAKFGESAAARDTVARAQAAWQAIHNRAVLTVHRRAIQGTAALAALVNRQ